MDAKRWNRLKTVFDEALDLPESERPAFIERVCGDDEELLNELKSLLEEEASVIRLLDGVAIEATTLLKNVTQTGQRIGSYLLKEQLGVGGMGEVYLAERADGQFERQVALKLVRGDIRTDRMLARFHSERRILSRLRHPNIAQLLDAGVTDDGRPYFVLEYIVGVPIDEYANEHDLDVDGRLELFDQVCRAVTYAHTSLIVHRDLKPSNVLVTEDGTVKLLDFGIAKILDADDQDGHHMTRTGAALMTPAYASPEQARGEPVSTLSDIYSLGVILYELLTGLRPYEVDPANPVESARVICDVEPERLSTRVATGQTGAKHGSDTGRLHRILQGDLDVICLKALRKEPERRYTSSDELREDIRRHLNDEPIRARSESRSYRFQKFVKRHRFGVFGTAVVVVLVAGLVGYYTMRLSGERDRAQQEAEKARQVVGFLQDIFTVPNPEQNQGQSLTVREVLDQGAMRLEEELSSQPEVLVELLAVMADTYRGLGLARDAIRLDEKAIILNADLYGRNSEAVASSLHDIGRNYYRLGELTKADSLQREALVIRRALLGGRHDLIAESLNSIGLIAERQGRYAEAESLLTEAIELRVALHGPDEPSLAALYNNLGRVEDRRGYYQSALERYNETLRLQRFELEPPHPYIAIALKNRADTERKFGRSADARSTYRGALAMYRELFDPDHPSIAQLLLSYARLQIDTDSLDAAMSMLSDAERIYVSRAGPDYPGLASIWNEKARVETARRNFPAADSLIKRALEMNFSEFGGQTHRTAEVLGTRAELELAEGRPAEALATRRQALAIRREYYGDEHPRVASDLEIIADCLFALGRNDEAEQIAVESRRMRRAFGL